MDTNIQSQAENPDRTKGTSIHDSSRMQVGAAAQLRDGALEDGLRAVPPRDGQGEPAWTARGSYRSGRL